MSVRLIEALEELVGAVRATSAYRVYRNHPLLVDALLTAEKVLAEIDAEQEAEAQYRREQEEGDERTPEHARACVPRGEL